MDLSIAASELAKGTDKCLGASINIISNTQTADIRYAGESEGIRPEHISFFIKGNR